MCQDGLLCVRVVYCVLGQCTVGEGVALCCRPVYCMVGQCTVC